MPSRYCEEMHCQNTATNSRMLFDRGYIGRHFGTRASLCKGGSAQNPGQRAYCHRNRASRWHTWIFSINGAAYPNKNSLDIQSGKRVGIVFTNSTNMGHPMHLHGHDFQVVEIDGERMSGALRDTLMVPPRSKMTVAFDADNVGVWPMHCHLLYHLDTGMFTVVKYEGADAKFWQPDAQAKAFGTSN